jgi:hypothetical protein
VGTSGDRGTSKEIFDMHFNRKVVASLGAIFAAALVALVPLSASAATTDWEVCTEDNTSSNVQFESHWTCPNSGNTYVYQFVHPNAFPPFGSNGPEVQVYVWRIPPGGGSIVPYATLVNSGLSTYKRWQLFDGTTRCWQSTPGTPFSIVEVSPQNCAAS